MTKSWPSGRKKGWSFGAGGNKFSPSDQTIGVAGDEDTPSPKIEGISLANALRSGERGAIILPEIDILLYFFLLWHNCNQ